MQELRKKNCPKKFFYVGVNLCFGHFFKKKICIITFLSTFWRWLEINFLVNETTHIALQLCVSEIGDTGRQGRELAFDLFEQVQKKSSPREGFDHTTSGL